MSLEELSETEWEKGISRLNETRENLDVLFSLIEEENNDLEVRKVIGDQTSILIKEFLESHIRQRTFWQLREKIDEC